ncbi:hypothetical protein [Marinomonas sp. ef1]|uniref:hypothetical protein n=1 Tax=Marinomonas sp. ef1 TaxID=2005043 RepID=UPI000C292D5A|nr:hypothetical protein [Marinomonas sp. ef1]
MLLSWLGMSAVAGFSWVFVFFAVIFNLIQRDVEMGILGFVYICSGFLGLILHSGLNPGHLFEELKSEFSKAITDTQKEELLAAGDATKKAAAAASELAAQAVKVATKI